jgi:hypothetical protein
METSPGVAKKARAQHRLALASANSFSRDNFHFKGSFFKGLLFKDLAH